MKSHRKQSKKKHTNSSQEGYLSVNIKKLMSRNEKIIMGVLVGGILIFLVLSLILLFGGGKDDTLAPIPTDTAPGQRVNTTPYPTIPPVEDMTVMVNERRLNPQTVTIKSGNTVGFFNIGSNAVRIEGADANSGFLNFSIPVDEVYEYTFRNAGTFTYRVVGTNLVGTITIE